MTHAENRPMFYKGTQLILKVRHVYFIRGEVTGLIKIGVANRAHGRMKDLQAGSPDRLILMGIIASERGVDLERELHVRFAHHRRHGEWFAPGDDLLKFIAEQTDGERRAAIRQRLEADDAAWARVTEVATLTAIDHRGRVDDAAIAYAEFEEFGMDMFA